MKKEQYHYDYVYVVEDFLEQSECQRFVTLAESLGFDDAAITTSREITWCLCIVC